jgi:hypothetical protein
MVQFDEMNDERQETPRKNATFDYHLIRFIAGSNQPVSLVENKFFKEFVEVLNRTYKIPCRKTISKKVYQMRSEIEQTIQNELNEVQYATVTCDNWSSISNQSYLGNSLE